jgi:DNA primase
MRYDEDTIERVKEASDIVDVIGRHLELKRSGSTFKTLCPFHQEKTPSFMVNPARQIFHCFGCDTGGDVIRFIMLYEGLPFVDSLKKLALRSGIELPEGPSSGGVGRDQKDPMFTANKMAAEYYSGLLMKSEEGKKARDYLGQRGIHSDVSKTFDLGYAPEGWKNLSSHLRKEGILESVAVSAGLLVKGDSGKDPYDRFRDRVVFPIRDLSGRILGFGGRVMGDDLPKYINTSETPVYRKGDSLFGLDVAAPFVREAGEVILVEGYLDVISLHQGGVRNVVGVLGTAFTEDQARKLRRLTEHCVLLFDSDEAGRRAVLRSGLILLGGGFVCRVAPLDPGEDPDSFLHKMGTQELVARIAQAPDVVMYTLESARQEHPGDKMGDRFQVIDAIVPYLAKIEDRAKLGAYLKEIGDILRIEQHDLRARLVTLKKRKKADIEVKEPPPPLRKDRLLLHILIREPEVVPKVKEIIRTGDIKSPEIAEIVDKIFSGVNLTSLLNTVDDRWKNKLSRWAMEDPLEGTKQALDDLLLHYTRERLEEKIRHIRDRLTEAVRRGAKKESQELNEEWKDLQAELRDLAGGKGLHIVSGGGNSSGGEDGE